MNLLCLIVITSNVLGSFNDPFEFEGDYGSESNITRKRVFELVVSKEALSKNATGYADQKESSLAIIKAIREDKNHGPTLSELITPALINLLQEKQQELKFNPEHLSAILAFIKQNQDQKLFYFLRNNPSDLLGLDKILRDKASREGNSFDLPILSSTQPLKGLDAEELKINLMNKLFKSDVLAVTKPENSVKNSITDKQLHLFATPVGQVFFYWLYQSMNLHLVSQEPELIEQINTVKTLFAQTLGDSLVRAATLKQKLMTAQAGVLFTQESDSFVPAALTEDYLFHPLGNQNKEDGTLVFLRSDLWESDFQVIAIDNYDGFAKGRLNVILATSRVSGQKFVLASAHGNSTRPEDGRLQITLIKQKFDELKQDLNNKDLQLIIGIDANTKSEQDVEDLMNHLDDLGLISTSVGPTTIKQRMVTAQHGKVGKFAIDEEDYIIILKPENGSLYQLQDPTVGFKSEKPDVAAPLPNLDNLSDHYPVGANLAPL